MKKIKLALLSLSWLSGLATADDFKLGYINVDRVFAEAKPAKAIQQALKDKFGPEQKQLETFNNNMLNQQKQMQEIANKAPSFDKLNKTDQSKLKNLEENYRKEQGQFQQRYMLFQQNLQKSQEVALSMLMTKTNAILKNISDKKGYDLVLTSNQLVFAKAKYDLTDQVMEQLDTIDPNDIIKQLNNPQALPMPGAKPGVPNPAMPTAATPATSTAAANSN